MKYALPFLLLLNLPLYAQYDLAKMEVVGTPVLSETEIVAKRMPNGRYCAGIKLISDLEGFSYDSYLGVMGMKEMPGQDIIYVDPAERVLLLYHVGYEPLKVILCELGIQLKERQMWEIKVKGGKVDVLPVSFILTPKDAEVIIDGNNMGSGPTFQIKLGAHVVCIKKENYISKTDTIKVDPNNVLFSYVLAKKPEMVFVKGGSFDMGDESGHDNEKLVHKITLNNFYIGKYEVTFAEYDLYCEVSGMDKPVDEVWGRDSRPVIHISWYDAVEYCNWLSKQENLTLCYTIDKTHKDPNNMNNYFDNIKWLVSSDFTANGYRLPSEAEWEYSARGGEKSKGYKYSGNNNVNDVAWYTDNAEGKTHPVGQKKSNELGVYDMSGNVWEWCWDWYGSDYYSDSPRDNPHGPVNGSFRVLRGSNWFSDKRYVCSTSRYRSNADGRRYGIGFRLCRTYVHEKENDK